MAKTILAVSAASLLLASCNIDHGPPGEALTETHSVEAGKVEMVRVDLRLHAGELQLTGGGSKLMEGEFRHDSRSGKPEIRYETTGFRGRLNIQSGSKSFFGPGAESDKWIVKLGGELPLDLHVGMGAGEGNLQLAGLNPRRVEVEIGAGELKIDLRDRWQKDFDVEIRGGVGEATVYLPRDVGVVAEARGGIGEIKVEGLQKQGSRWVNSNYEKVKTTIRVDVRGGVGQINLIGE
jgi:hypothetical protein